jgi:hypothetical protein
MLTLQLSGEHRDLIGLSVGLRDVLRLQLLVHSRQLVQVAA